MHTMHEKVNHLTKLTSPVIFVSAINTGNDASYIKKSQYIILAILFILENLITRELAAR